MTKINKFFNALITMPYIGPSKKEPSNAGRSEISIFIKDGINAGMEKSMNISKNAVAESTAVSTSERVVILLRLCCIQNHSLFLFERERANKTDK